MEEEQNGEEFDELSLDTIKEINDPLQEASRNNTYANQQYPSRIMNG
jgi:hypothetical protein